MASYRKVTFSLPINLLRQLKRMATRRQTSVSRLVTQTLEELAAREDAYARARDRHPAWLAQAADLGTQGHIDWPREALHGR
jgi:hypothetical protein